jgi:hypothetical protein
MQTGEMVVFDCPYCKKNLCGKGAPVARISVTKEDLDLALRKAAMISKSATVRQLIGALHDIPGRRMSRQDILRKLNWPVATYQDRINRMVDVQLVKREGPEVELVDFLIPPFTPEIVCAYQTGSKHGPSDEV